MASVTIDGVHKMFGTTRVLHGVSIDIADGAFVVLVGPSGCGKSTLLRMIAGLESVAAGEIRIGAQRVNDVPARERDIAMVFQHHALYPHLTVFENMAFALRVRRAPEAEVERSVRKAAASLGLEALLERLPRQLSGGQRQRVAMGRAIVRDPRVFLFDEPLSSLDAKLRVAMRAEIKALHQRVGGTTIYVTHDQIEAMTMADRIVVMHDGKVAQTGAPLDVYDAPANTFVAGFIGSPSMNLITGVVDGAGPPRLRTADGTMLPLPLRAGLETGRRVVLGARPEHVRWVDAGTGIAALVRIVEPTGPEIQLHARLAGHEIVAVLRERHVVRAGDVVRLDVDLAQAHVFDAATGASLLPLAA